MRCMASKARTRNGTSVVPHPVEGHVAAAADVGGKGGHTVSRSAGGQFTSKTAGTTPPTRTASLGGDEVATPPGAYVTGSVVRKRPATPQPRNVVRARGQGRSTAADDPLAPARTRWLADVVGGGARLAELLGVSASQTSRWAAGQERPGIRVAPLLIDLEHVLARARLVWAEPAASTWMVSVNAHLGGARPVDVLRLSGPGPVLDALDAGVWGGAA